MVKSRPQNCGLGYRVRFSLRADGLLDAEWTPRRPTGRDQRRVQDRYQAARDAYLLEVAQAAGLRSVTVLEVQ